MVVTTLHDIRVDTQHGTERDAKGSNVASRRSLQVRRDRFRDGGSSAGVHDKALSLKVKKVKFKTCFGFAISLSRSARKKIKINSKYNCSKHENPL